MGTDRTGEGKQADMTAKMARVTKTRNMRRVKDVGRFDGKCTEGLCGGEMRWEEMTSRGVRAGRRWDEDSC